MLQEANPVPTSRRHDASKTCYNAINCTLGIQGKFILEEPAPKAGTVVIEPDCQVPACNRNGEQPPSRGGPHLLNECFSYSSLSKTIEACQNWCRQPQVQTRGGITPKSSPNWCKKESPMEHYPQCTQNSLINEIPTACITSGTDLVCLNFIYLGQKCAKAFVGHPGS